MPKSDTYFTSERQPDNKGNTYASKYNDKYATLMDQYFSGDHMQEDGKLKTLGRFAKSVKIHFETLMIWANEKDENGEYKHPRFRASYVDAKEYLAEEIADGAMTNRYNANFASFILQTDYGRIPASKTEIKADADIKAKTTITINVSDVKKD